MRRFQFEREQYLPLDIETTFAFFTDARNLERLTPPWLHFEVLTPGEIEPRAGARIDYRLRLRGIPLRWQSEITIWEPTWQFVDVQRRGPYRVWVHTHTVETLGSGALERDAVTYAFPGGGLVKRLLVGPDVTKILDPRARQFDVWARARVKQATRAPISASR